MAAPGNQIGRNIAVMTFGQRITLLLVVAATVAALVAVWFWAQKPEMGLLYSNLSSEDAGAVVKKLQEGGTPYELTAAGSAVLVPSDRVYDLRLQLAGEGLPNDSGVGFEIFDQTSIGVTEFAQKVNYRRALQGELARTIGKMSGVSAARVQINMPDKSLFARQQEPATASVMVTLRSGKMLSKEQVQGIAHLVSSSVTGLDPGMVSVVDQHGKTLSETADDAALLTANSQYEYQQKFENDMRDKLLSLLEEVVGEGNAAVRVSSLLDLRRIESTEEKFDPDFQVARSEQQLKESVTGSSQSTPGAPGVLTNLPPGTQPSPQSTGQSASQKTTVVSNYEISKTINKIIEPMGVIKRLSVAVMVDGTYEVTKEGDKEIKKYIPRSGEEMKKFEELVKAAMGFTATRGDKLEITSVPMGLDEAPATAKEVAAEEEVAGPGLNILQLVKYLVVLVAVILAFLFIIKPLMGSVMGPAQLTQMAGVGGPGGMVGPWGGPGVGGVGVGPWGGPGVGGVGAGPWGTGQEFGPGGPGTGGGPAGMGAGPGGSGTGGGPAGGGPAGMGAGPGGPGTGGGPAGMGAGQWGGGPEAGGGPGTRAGVGAGGVEGGVAGTMTAEQAMEEVKRDPQAVATVVQKWLKEKDQAV